VIPILFLIVTVTLSVLITRVGTVALTLTGISKESAFFQARSAFYGVGFTTAESEMVVNHPVRRRIVVGLLVLGNLGIATMVASLIVSLMASSNSGQWTQNLLLLAAGLTTLCLLGSSRWLNQTMSRLLTAALRRWTSLDVRDYLALLHLCSGYAVLEMRGQPTDFLADMTLAELNLSACGILVLGIQRASGLFVGAPTGQTRILAQDTLIMYGPLQKLEELDRRRVRRCDPQSAARLTTANAA